MTAGDDDQVWSEGLQLERTSLAWRRLALVLLGLALAVPRLGWPAIGIWTLVPAGVVAAGATTLLVASHRRYVSTHRSLTSGTVLPLPDGRLIALTVLSALTLAAVAVVIVAAQFT
jgi:putative membrane protein